MRSNLFLTVESWLRCPSNNHRNEVNMSIISSFYFDYSSGMTTDLHQYVCSLFEEVDGDDSASVLMVTTTLESVYSSLDDLYGPFVLIIVGIGSSQRPSTLRIWKLCNFAEVLLTRIKYVWLGIARTISFAGMYPFGTRLESGSKRGRTLNLLVNQTEVI